MYFKTISVERIIKNIALEKAVLEDNAESYTSISWLKITFEDESIKKLKVSGELMTFKKYFFVIKNKTENLFEFYDEDCKIIYRDVISSTRDHPLKLKLLINYFYFIRSEDLLKDHYLINFKI